MSSARNALRAAREAVAASRGELALASGVSVDMIRSIEDGRRRPSPATSQRLERGLLRVACARIGDIEAACAAVAALDAAGESERVPS